MSSKLEAIRETLSTVLTLKRLVTVGRVHVLHVLLHVGKLFST